MQKRRKYRRRDCHYSALIDAGDGSLLRACKLVDVSEGGAKLVTDNSDLIPDVFTLLLSGNGAVRRACVVVWRLETVIGVQFLPSVGSGRGASARL